MFPRRPPPFDLAAVQTGGDRFDITKGDQASARWSPACTACTARRKKRLTMLARRAPLVRARTDFLAAAGWAKWVEGCGLTHLTIWLEEAPDIIELLNNANAYETWESDVKAGRSAGIRGQSRCSARGLLQMPTLIRGQLAKMCFGVAEESDAAFGLSRSSGTARHSGTVAGQPARHVLPGRQLHSGPVQGDGDAHWFWARTPSRVAEFAAAHRLRTGRSTG